MGDCGAENVAWEAPAGGGDTSKESTYEYTNRVFGHVVGKFGGDYSRG